MTRDNKQAVYWLLATLAVCILAAVTFMAIG